jgi:glycosyltransferase involved in cell wall biosynthesis
MSTADGLSVVIPTRDRPELLRACLASVLASVDAGDEVIVVDSASSDPAVREVVEATGAQYVRCELPGVCRARNAGVRAAEHDIIAFVDDDVQVSREWADAVRTAMAAHPDAAFLTGRIEVPSGQDSGPRPVALKTEREAAVLDGTTTGTLGHSANMAVRRAAFERIGGFDEELGAGGRFRSAPEVDLFDRLFAAGSFGRYEPAALAWHEQWRSRRDLLRLEWSYGIGFGARLAKLTRADRVRARVVAREYLWEGGLAVIPDAVRNRYELGVALALVRIGAVALGLARAALVPVEGGHLRPRQR